MSTGIGASLREAREGQGRTLEDAALSLRARVSQLEALEAEEFAIFGGDVYARGFLKSYAAELGLDPAPLLEAYRRDVGDEEVRATTLIGAPSKPAKQRVKRPAWIAWVLVVVVLFAGVAVVGLLDRTGRTPEVASPDQPSTPPPSPVEEDDEDGAGDGETADDETDTGSTPGQDDSNGVEETEDEAPEAEEELEGVDLVLALEENSWMRVVVDGTVALEAEADAGETLQYDAEQEIQLRLGNAGGVRIELNGDDLGAQGGRGEVVEVLLTPEGAELL